MQLDYMRCIRLRRPGLEMYDLQVNLPTPQSELQRSDKVELALSVFNFQKESVGLSKSVRCSHKQPI